ncbi:MAG: tetratricopeptide repeat protein [Paludibacter sp.]
MKYILTKHNFLKLFFVVLIVLVSGCSTKKNTWASRTFHATNTRFNVYFNGYVSYNDGLKTILKANKEDYSTVIPMFPISRHSNAAAAKTDMERTIEKCRKAIKLHSIKIKPEKDYKKANSPEYQLFYNQQEFNPALSEAWLLLAKAEFHKGDFLGSVGTFSYISKHYVNDKDIVAQCQLWTARAYGEMGWIYEAEQVLSKLKQDDLKSKNIGLFSSINADLLLKKHQYKEAIPFLELALSKESNSAMEQRFGFVLAQLYEKTNDNKAAYEAFSKVIKSNPPYEMDFNARISRTQLNVGSVSNLRKDLRKMLKNKNNKEYLDQIYFALGNTFMQHADTLHAIENYKLSTKNSTRNGIDKAVTLITLGDLYYTKRNYVLAQPCYEEAGKIITNEQEDFARVTKRAETLSELVTQNNIVLLQDSLQRLAAMPEKARLEVVNKLIEKMIADEKAAAEKTLKESIKVSTFGNGEEDFASLPPIGGNMPGIGGEWYFYNQNLIRTGQTEFQKKWGKRKLEDNWRRTNKTTSLFGDDNTASALPNDSSIKKDSLSKKEGPTDVKSPEFYLRQIPVTPAQMTKSNAELATALFNMGLVYKDKVEDIPMAISTFEEFIRRFGSDKRIPDAYFQIYLMDTKLGKQTEANAYRTKLITEFPKSKYSEILSQPDYTERLVRMYKEQDSIYSLTYEAYNKSDFETVYKHVSYIQKNFPLSTLMPKFLFLNALSIGKKESVDKFETALNELVKAYPESDVSAMSKDILALMKQGHEAKKGSTSGSLLTRRDEKTKSELEEINKQEFSNEKLTKHRLLLISNANSTKMNKLLYNIASFNFSRFMIKDFDLVINKLDSTHNALSITNLESYDEALWYEKSLVSDNGVNDLFKQFEVQKIIISEENYALLKTGFGLKDYMLFDKKYLSGNEKMPISTQKPIKKQEPVIIKDNTSKNTLTVAPKAIEKTEVKMAEKPIEKVPEKVVEKTVVKVPEKVAEKPVEKVIPPVKTVVKPETAVVAPPATTTVQPKKDDVPLFKNLFAYRANEPHFIAIYVLSGKIDFEKIKAAFDKYNAANYGVMNLKVSLESANKQQVIIIGSLADAYIAKSYLLRMIKDKTLFEGLKNANYRNLLGSQKNLNTLMQNDAMDVYFDFMSAYYLK